MSHNLMTRNGKTAMFCVGDRDAAWHKLGQRTPDAITWAEAIKLADLDWEVVKKQMYFRNALGQVTEASDYFATTRSDDGAFLGVVQSGYAISQNKDAFTDIDSLLSTTDGAHYESAGALDNGKQIWVMARIPEADYEIDGGDKHKTYLLVATSHDRSMSKVFKMVDERVVCANTMAIALSESGGCSFKIRHTANAQERTARAMEQLRAVKDTALSLKQKMLRLAETKLTRESTKAILDRLFSVSADPKANTTRRENLVTDVLNLYASNDRDAFPSVKGTAYNLLNAVTEYTDHLRTARGNGSEPAQMAVARSESALFGSGSMLKTQALQVIIEETAKIPGNAGLLDLIIQEHHR
jgi:phage/plasmid-like protein (TIGR03299 family)